jgi:hypothetical protein
MAILMFQYDRPTDNQNWNNYNRHVRDWIGQLLKMPGAVSFVAYRTANQESPDTLHHAGVPHHAGGAASRSFGTAEAHSR